MAQFTNGHNSVKSVDGVMVLNLCTSFMMFYICTKFQENILKGFRVIERMQFFYTENFKGA